MKGHPKIKKRQQHPLLIPLGSALAAMLLSWVVLSNVSLKLWIIIGVGAFVFIRTLYLTTVSWYLRSASLMISLLLFGNIGNIAFEFFNQTERQNFLRFVYESSNTITNLFLLILILGCISADVVIKCSQQFANSSKGKRSKTDTTIKASSGSAVIQNSPGATVTTNSGIGVEQAEKLVDTVQTQAGVIDRLILRQNVPINLKYTPKKEQDENQTNDILLDDYLWNDNIQVSNEQLQEDVETSDHTITANKARVRPQDVATILQKLETVDDIASEIQAQLDLWNNDIALELLDRFEEQLRSAESSSFPRLTDYLFLAARIHVVSAERNDNESAVHVERANEHLKRIEKQCTDAPQQEIAKDINALRGSIENIQNGPESALRFLANSDDPYATRIRIAMHLKLKDADGAVREIRGKQPHLRWCDLGASAYSASGNRIEATALTEWAKENGDQKKYFQCVVRLADSSLARALANHEAGKNIYSKDLSKDEQNALKLVIEDIAPVLSSVISSGTIDSELDNVAVRVAWQAYLLLGESSEVARLAQLMSTRTPVPPDVARSVVSGYMSPPPDLSQRLRSDHPNDFNANILAAIVEARSGECVRAYKEAKKLLLLADSNERKEELFGLFQDLWQELDAESASECEGIARSLINHNPRLLRTFDAAQALSKGDGELALGILDELNAEDDTYWLQLRGNALLQLGRLPDAVEMFQSAAHLTGVPTLLHKTADLAYQAEKTSIAVECYEALVIAQPDNLTARSNLASLYAFNLHDTGKAAAQFKALHDAEPNNVEHTVNLAVCLSRLYRTDESLTLYDEACDVDTTNLRAVLGRAELYLSLGNPEKACDSLKDFRNSLWNSPDFLLGYMNIAYAAGDDDIAQDALQKLTELRKRGLVDENAFRMVDTDEAIETFKEHLRAEEQKNNQIHSMMLKGHMPWIWAAQLTGDAIYWAWRLRAQEMPWIGDVPKNRASFTIYSTNAFHAQETDDGHRELLPLVCPPQGTKIVADLSALITLHRLDLLDKTAEYFGEILIPEGYLETVLADGKKLIVHQRSRQRTADEISRFIASNTITIGNQINDDDIPLPTVDEYDDSENHRYRLIDLLDPMHKAGLVDDMKYDRLRKICTKESGVNEEHAELSRLQYVNVALSALEAFATFGLLEELTKYYRINISSDAETELENRLKILNSKEETLIWHFDLWDTIISDERIKFVKPSIPKKLENEATDGKDLIGFQASFIAQDLGIPLLADDRACQAMTLNERRGLAYSAFGTDACLLKMTSSGNLSSSTAAEMILKIMRWRYRFIIPSSNILKTYTSHFRSNPPGLSLREVAEYLHDCMRDAGLFGGAENTDLKDSMALRLYLFWVDLIADWLVEIWSDKSFEENTAVKFTGWAIQECLPSQPAVLDAKVKVKVASMTSRILISHMLFKSNHAANRERTSSAMKALQAALKLSDEEYQKIVLDILHESK